MLQQTYIFGSWAESWNACFLAVSQTSAEISYAQILQRLFICLLLIAISNIFENIISTEAATNWITLKWCILGLNIAQIGWCVSWGAMEHLWSMYKLVINFFFGFTPQIDGYTWRIIHVHIPELKFQVRKEGKVIVFNVTTQHTVPFLGTRNWETHLESPSPQKNPV